MTTILDKKIKTIPPLPRFHAKNGALWLERELIIDSGGGGGGVLFLILFCPIVAIVDFFRGQSFVTFRCYLHVTSQFDTSIICQVLLVISLGSRADRHIANKVYRLPRPSPIASLSEFFPRPLRRLVWRIASAKTRDRI